MTVPPIESLLAFASWMRCRVGKASQHRVPVGPGENKRSHLLHQFGRLLVRASHRVLVDLFPRQAVHEFEVLLTEEVVVARRIGDVDLADGRNERDNLDTVSHLEVAFGNRASSNTA